MTSAPAFVPVLHGAVADRPDEADTVIAAETIRDALGRLGYRSEIVHLGLDLGALSALAARRPVLVFNLVEALAGDGTLAHLAPAALEHFSLAYSGGTAQSLRDTLSKTAAKRLLQSAGLPTPAWSQDGSGLDGVERVIVKSIGEHASIGIDAGSVVAAGRAAEEIAARQARFGGRFFAEAFIEGREFNLALLDGPDGPRLLPIAEIDFVDYPDDRPRIVDYEAKWEDGSFAFGNTPRHFDFPAADGPLLKRLGELALATWQLFDLTGYVRVDFRVDSMNRPWILEINVNPCLSPDAGFAAAAARAGMDYDEMIGCIVSSALARRRPEVKAVCACSAPAEEADMGSREGPAERTAGLAWREAVQAEDIEGVRMLVAGTAMFSDEEIDIAAELVMERIEKGPASGYEFVFVEEDGKLAGYSCYGLIPGSETSYDLYWIAVDAGRQGQGLGREILARTEDVMRRIGARHVYVDTSSSEKYVPTRGFYLGTGYTVAAEFADFYRPGDGKVIFVKDLRK